MGLVRKDTLTAEFFGELFELPDGVVYLDGAGRSPLLRECRRAPILPPAPRSLFQRFSVVCGVCAQCAGSSSARRCGPRVGTLRRHRRPFLRRWKRRAH
jgi:hypothetical protein